MKELMRILIPTDEDIELMENTSIAGVSVLTLWIAIPSVIFVLWLAAHLALSM